MFLVAIRNLTTHRARSIATAVAVALGSAFLAGTLVLADTARAALDRTFGERVAHTDVHVRAESAFPTWGGDERPRIEAEMVSEVAAVAGVAEAEARIEGYAQLFDRRGTPLGRVEDAVGANWSTLAGSPLRLVKGRAPTADDEIVIDRKSARAAGYGVGDRVRIATNAGPISVEVVGIAAFGSDGDGGAQVLFSEAAAERWLAQPGRVDAIAAVAEPGVTAETIRGRIRDALGDRVEVLTTAELAAERGSINAGVSASIRTLLLAFAAVALFVGAFIINNTFTIVVAQRHKEVAMLRAVGATRRQVVRSVLAEAAVIGSVGAVTGAVAGVGVAAGLRRLVTSFGFDVPEGPMVVRPGIVVASVIIGTLTALASAVLPALRAASVAPVAALRDAAVDTSPRSRRRFTTGVVLMLIGAMLVIGPLLTGEEVPVLIGLGTGVVFLGMTALGPALVVPFISSIGRLARGLGGLPADLARRNTGRNARRTSGAAASLMIGIGLVTLIAVFASSAKASVSRPDGGAAATPPDFVVQPASSAVMGFSPSLAQRVAELDEVESVGSARSAVAQVDGDPGLPVLGVDAAWIAMSPDTTVAGDTASLGLDDVSVLDEAARMKGWTIGSRITLRFEEGERVFRVAATRSSGAPFLVDLRALDELVAERLDMVVLVRKSVDVTTGAAESAIRELVQEYPTATLLDARGRSPQQVASIDQFANAVYVLLGLALLIALLGVATTLSLSVVERTREIGLLRAVGMTDHQVSTMIRVESLLIVLFGSGLGLAAGLLFAWAVLQGLPDDVAFRVPVVQLATVIVLAAAAALVAAAGPARRASRSPIVTALAKP